MTQQKVDEQQGTEAQDGQAAAGKGKTPKGFRPEGDFQRLESTLNRRVSDAEKDRDAAITDRDKAKTDLEVAQLGDDEEGQAEALRNLRKRESEVARGERELGEEQTRVAKEGLEAAAVAVHNKRGIPLEVLAGAESIDQLESLAKDWELEQWRTGKMKNGQKATASYDADDDDDDNKAPAYERGEGSRTTPDVSRMSREEFEAHNLKVKAAALKRTSKRS
jgi:hypothetical protein